MPVNFLIFLVTASVALSAPSCTPSSPTDPTVGLPPSHRAASYAGKSQRVHQHTLRCATG